MVYNFTDNISNYLIEKYITQDLGVTAENTIGVVKNIMFKDEEVVELCKKLDEDFDKLLTVKLENNNIKCIEGETVDKQNNVYPYSQFVFNENGSNGYSVRYERDEMVKINFVNENLKKIAKYLSLQKDFHVKRYIKLLKEQDKISNRKNAIIKYFALRKIRRDLIVLNTNRTVYSYTELLKQKDMLNAILAIKTELSDENLLNSNYGKVETDIDTKISRNEFNSELIKQLNEEKEIYKSFYETLNKLQQKMIDLTKVETKKENNLKEIDAEIEMM